MDPERKQREFQWLLETQLTTLIGELKTKLEQCSLFIQAATLDVESPQVALIKSLKDARVVEFESQEKDMKGFVVMEGCSIVEAEVTLPNKRGGSSTSKPQLRMKTAVQSSNPYPLHQLQNIYNYVCMASDTLITALPSLDKLTPAAILQMVNKVSPLIQAAKNQLLLSGPTVIARNSPVPPTFQPPLPSDCHLEFKIRNKMLVVNYTITFYQKTAQTSRPQTEQYSVECKSHKLTTISTLLQNSWDICLELQEKSGITCP